MAVAETSLVKKNHQISTIINQKITQKLIEKVPMTAIAESLSVSTSTVIRKLKEFEFELYEVSEIYFHFLESIRNKKSCQDALKQRYNTENIDIEKIIQQIKENLLNLGVILND